MGPRENEEIVGTAGYFLNPSTNLAEMAYMIVPDWQGTGLGSALQQRLKEFAVGRGVRGFVAELLQTNRAMLNLAKRLGPIDLHTDEDGISHVTALFTSTTAPIATGRSESRRVGLSPTGKSRLGTAHRLCRPSENPTRAAARRNCDRDEGIASAGTSAKNAKAQSTDRVLDKPLHQLKGKFAKGHVKLGGMQAGTPRPIGKLL